MYFLPVLVFRYFPWGLKVSEALFVQKKLLLGVCHHIIRVVTKKLKQTIFDIFKFISDSEV